LSLSNDASSFLDASSFTLDQLAMDKVSSLSRISGLVRHWRLNAPARDAKLGLDSEDSEREDGEKSNRDEADSMVNVSQPESNNHLLMRLPLHGGRSTFPLGESYEIHLKKDSFFQGRDGGGEELNQQRRMTGTFIAENIQNYDS
jgi:hypothetical protein